MRGHMGRKPKDFVGHLERYVFALPYIEGKRVLDAGCKDGYGSHLMSAFIRHLTLVDRTDTWLNMAMANYKYFCRKEFILMDFDEEFPEGTWDAIVAFEIIEHVADPDRFLKDISEHLTTDGILIFSVPHMVENPDHKTLFDKEKIVEYVSRYLKIEEFYIQDKLGISGKPATSPPVSYVGIARKI